MTTIKSYTDLDQSRKLAEFLPIESADMVWANDNDVIVVPYDMVTRENVLHDFAPCWSLVALLDVFPNSEQKSVDVCHGGWKGEEYVSNWFCSYDNYEKNYFETTNSDNPIDACYEMILKLHEQKLL